jgi:hypothetical protein
MWRIQVSGTEGDNVHVAAVSKVRSEQGARLRALIGAQYSTLCGVYICSWRSHQSANGLHVTDQVTYILGITYEYENTKVSLLMHDVFVLGCA